MTVSAAIVRQSEHIARRSTAVVLASAGIAVRSVVHEIDRAQMAVASLLLVRPRALSGLARKRTRSTSRLRAEPTVGLVNRSARVVHRSRRVVSLRECVARAALHIGRTRPLIVARSVRIASPRVPIGPRSVRLVRTRQRAVRTSVPVQPRSVPLARVRNRKVDTSVPSRGHLPEGDFASELLATG